MSGLLDSTMPPGWVENQLSSAMQGTVDVSTDFREMDFMIGMGGSGQWVRTHDERSAKLFLAEREQQAADRRRRSRRSRDFWRYLRLRLRESFGSPR